MSRTFSKKNTLKMKAPDKMKGSYIIKQSELQTLANHPEIFGKINAFVIRKATMNTHDSHGSSRLDASEWRRMLTTFRLSTFPLISANQLPDLQLKSPLNAYFFGSHTSCRLRALDSKSRSPTYRDRRPG